MIDTITHIVLGNALWSFPHTRTCPLFTADWRRAVFAHFHIEPRVLQPLVPFELETYRGLAFVSLVACTQGRLRPARGSRVPRWLLAPLAQHTFLNLRTYVRGPGGVPGIFFIAEWVPNRLAAFLGPRTYGLPYRLGRLEYDFDLLSGELRASVAGAGGMFGFTAMMDPRNTGTPAPPDTLDHFLLERYVAFTARDGVRRRFDVDHVSWPQQPIPLTIHQLSLVDAAGLAAPSLHYAGAHLSAGVYDVRISPPVTVETECRMKTLPRQAEGGLG